MEKTAAKKIILKTMLSMDDALAMASATVGVIEPKIGQLVDGKGVFIGAWEPQDRDGGKLGKIFNVFAAPEDLMDEKGARLELEHADAVTRIGLLKNWHGHNGCNFESDHWLFEALKQDSYNGEWFLPTRDLLNGTVNDGNNENVHANSLFALQDTGRLKDTFTLSSGYWSCTKYAEYFRSAIYTEFKSGNSYGGYTDKLCSRPVRVEPRKP